MKTTRHIACAFAFAVLAIAGCAPSAPDKPTWVADVQPVMMANCVRCHGYPASGGAPDTFRLDRFDDGVFDGRLIRGAFAMSRSVCARVSAMGDMPPNGTALPARAGDLFLNWIDKTGCGAVVAATEKGTRAANGEPAIAVSFAPGSHDVALDVDYVMTDPDHDSVTAKLDLHGVARDAGCTVVQHDMVELHGGAGHTTFDASTLCAGKYTLTAMLSDGEQLVTRSFDNIEINHADDANLSPRIQLVSPAQDALLNAKVPDPRCVDMAGLPLGGRPCIYLEYNVVDADNSFPMTPKVEAVQGDTRVDLTPMNASITSAGKQTLQLSQADLDRAGFPAGTGAQWRFEISVTDSRMATRGGRSPYVVISDIDPTSLEGLTFYQDSSDGVPSIKRLLAGCKDCHGEAVEPPGVALDVTTFAEPPLAGTTLLPAQLSRRPSGESRLAALYRRLVFKRDMPPPSALKLIGAPATAIFGGVDRDGDSDVDEADNDFVRSTVGRWLLAGAPEGTRPPP